MKSPLLAGALTLTLLLGCQAPSSPTGTLLARRMVGTATLTLKPQWNERALQAVVPHYTRADVHHLVIQLFTLGEQEEYAVLDQQDAPVKLDLPAARLDELLHFEHLKADALYRIRLFAYQDAAEDHLISVTDERSFLDVYVDADGHAPDVAALPVRLADVPFDGHGQAHIVITSGGVSYTGTPGMAPVGTPPPAPTPAPLLGHVATYAGNGEAYGLDSSNRMLASFKSLRGLTVSPEGDLFVADGHALRKVAYAGAVTTVAGLSGSAGYLDGPAASARFDTPTDVARDAAGNLYVADSSNRRIRKVAPDGTVSTLAGSGETGSADGLGTAASFATVERLVMTVNGVLVLADEANAALRLVTPTTGAVSTFSTHQTAPYTGTVTPFPLVPHALAAAPDGKLYVLAGNELYRIDPDGEATLLTYYLWEGGDDLAVAPDGTVYISQPAVHVIRKVAPDGIVTTLAGGWASAGYQDAFGAEALFDEPRGLTFFPSGELLVADSLNHRLRVVF